VFGLDPAAPPARCGQGCGSPEHPADDKRAEPAAPVLAVHGTIVSVLVVTLGDALLDVIVRLGEPLTSGADALAATRTAAGGQAANVAAWVVALGSQARTVSKRGDDLAGRVVTAELEGRGVEVAGPVAGRNGIVVSLVGVDGERTMASDRGVAPELAPADLEPAWFACDCLHISGYALLATPIDGAALRAAELARGNGARVSVDLSAWTRIREHGPVRFREQLEELEADVIFANEAEWEIVGAAYGLAPTAVVKRGARGLLVLGEERAELPAREGEVVDATGAGDAFAAGFLVGGPELALDAAARCVATVGAMP
jgi:sugar/nucleoside kinase (ribokinase family)